jgi:phenylacetate-coenzyme A ligase PaaK-like adenylate-forming protein
MFWQRDSERMDREEIEQRVLLEVEGAAPHRQIVLERAPGAATLLVEVSEASSVDMKRLAELKERIERRMAPELGVGLDVKLVARNALERSHGKAKRAVDLR